MRSPTILAAEQFAPRTREMVEAVAVKTV